MNTPQEFEPLGYWMGWAKNRQFTDCGDWVDQNRFIRGYVNSKTSLTDSECMEAIKKLAATGYWPQLVYDDDGHWQLALSGGADISGECITVFCEQDMWFDTINAAIEAALSKLTAAERGKE